MASGFTENPLFASARDAGEAGDRLAPLLPRAGARYITVFETNYNLTKTVPVEGALGIGELTHRVVEEIGKEFMRVFMALENHRFCFTAPTVSSLAPLAATSAA